MLPPIERTTAGFFWSRRLLTSVPDAKLEIIPKGRAGILDMPIGLYLEISHVLRSANFPVCGIVGFQTRRALDRFDTLPTWKSATQQVGKPALLGGRPSRTGSL